MVVHGFDAGQPILYLSTEASDPLAAVLERAMYVPLLNQASFLGGDDALGSGRERIFPFLNRQTGTHNRNAQGLIHLIKDGHATEDANLANTALLGAQSRCPGLGHGIWCTFNRTPKADRRRIAGDRGEVAEDVGCSTPSHQRDRRAGATNHRAV